MATAIANGRAPVGTAAGSACYPLCRTPRAVRVSGGGHAQGLRLPAGRCRMRSTAGENARVRRKRFTFAPRASDGGGDLGDGVPELQGDWRAFRAGLVASERSKGSHNVGVQGLPGLLRLGSEHSRVRSTGTWAHPISQPEQGCLLVTKRRDMGFFDQAVILMLQHDDREGSYGLVLNRQSHLMVKDIGLDGHSRQAFADNHLYLGGPVQMEMLHVLHGVPAVEGTVPIIDGIYQGSVRTAAHMVLGGEVCSSEFQLISGYSGWAAHQLAAEIQDDSWYLISASRDVILNCMGHKRYNGANSRSVMWNYILQLAGVPISTDDSMSP